MQQRRWLTTTVGFLVVATCVACPISEMFDHWDHTARTGKDTESTLMVVALSVGLAFPTAGLVSLPALGTLARVQRPFLPVLDVLQIRVESFDAMSNSPPPTPLRI